MSDTPLQEPPALSSGSAPTLASRPLQPISDPSASKRVCFYKSGDHTFSGHRMVINTRTFKTFDALLDALSKKVPLPFGVRTITTPRGIHLVKGLDGFHDGGSYVCSDQKRVKPLNLDAVHQRQVPWNTTRPVSAGQRGHHGFPFGQFGRRNEAITRPAKRVALRTPKRLVVIKNRDPAVKRTIVLQRRTAPTFDALLDYLSQVMQFPVLKLYSADGRRVDGLAALILCSGVIVAAGNEPFRLGNHNVHRTAQMAQSIYSDAVEPSALQPQHQQKKSFSSGRGSRNFSLSSERFIVNQINKSRNGSTNSHVHRRTASFETEVNHNPTSVDMESCDTVRVDDGRHTRILPQDDDIEKSFRVNQDGSMTVEMKVRLNIKEEELLHWTTTLSRSSLSQRTVCASKSESGNSPPASDNTVAKDPSGISEDTPKDENHPTGIGNGIGCSDEQIHEGSPAALEKSKSRFKRTPTPGPRHASKRASVESIKMTTESGVQESTLGQYSYVERSETTEEYCVVRHISSSSNRPVPKPRKTASAGASKGSHSIRSGVAEIQNNGMEITETVMHISETQGCYDNYFANSTEGIPLHSRMPIPRTKPASIDSVPHSSSIDFTPRASTSDSLRRWQEEILSLSSEPISPAHTFRINRPSFTDNETRTTTHSPQRETESLIKDSPVRSEKKKKTIKPTGKRKSLPSISSIDKKQKDSIASPPKSSKHSSSDKLSSGTVGGRSLSSSKSDKSGQKGGETEKIKTKKKVSKDNATPREEQDALLNIENAKRTSSKKQMNTNHRVQRDNGHNVNTPETRPSMKKNMLDILQPKSSALPGKKVMTKQKAKSGNKPSSPKQTLTESVSKPTLDPSPSDLHQYVENWLQEVHPGSVPYTQETITEESEPQTKVVFQIGGDSEAKSECQTNTDDAAATNADAVTKCASSLSVPLCHEEPTAKDLCVSMPSVRGHPAHQQSRLRTNKSAEAFGPVDNVSSTSNLLSPKAQIKPVLQQLCSSLQCIRRASESKEPSDLEKSSSLPDFSTHVASVFGSSPKAFLSFLSVMTLRDTLTGSVARDSCGSRTASEAMLVMESLQKISTIEDEEEQRASLTDLQSRTSSQLKGHWRDFQVLRERLESEPLSPKFSEQEFALDVISEDGDAFDDQHIDELMEELNMPRDLREAISSTFQQSKRFYPEVEESTYVEKEIHCSEAKQSPEPDTDCIAETIAETSVKENNENGEVPAGESDSFNKMQSEEECEKRQEMGPDVKRSETGRTEMEEKVEPSKHPEPCLEADICEKQEDEGIGDEYKEGGQGKREGTEKEKQVEEVEEYGKEVKGREDDNTKDVEETTEEERQEKDGSEMREEFEEPDEKEVEGRGEEMIVSGEEEEEEKEELEERGTEVEGEEEWKGAEVEETDAKQHKVVETEEEEVTKKDEEEEWEDVEEQRENRDADEKEGEVEMNEKKEEVDENSEEKDEGVEVTEVIEIGEEEDAEEVIEIGEEEEDIVEKEEEVEEEEKVEEGGGGEVNEKDTDINEVEQSSEEEEEEEEEVSVEEQEQEEREDEVDMEAVQEVESCEGEAEEETEEGEEKQELNDGYKQVEERELKEENLRFREHVAADADGIADTKAGKRLLEETDCLRQQSSCEEANADTKGREHELASSIKPSSRGQCEDGADTVKDLKTDDGEEGNNSLLYPVGISQELLDFVNSALRSSSLIFTYDARGNVKIEPENARVVQTKRIMIPKSREDSLYGLKRLPSPSTSDLSDYRPETSESGGYKTQQSIDIASDSEEGPSERQSPNYRHTRHTNVERTNSKLSRRSPSELSQSPRLNSGGSFSSYDSRTKASREDLSYFSSASSLKAGMESVIKAAQCFSIASEVDSNDGVLIDQGRWLLKENHLIRKSPPVPIGMYGELDTTSIDTYQESEGSPKHYVTQNNPLAVISSSDLEEMAKPPTPKCTYYIMSHGSDSDPFLDDVSVTSGKKGKSNGKGKGLRVSPTPDTTRSWPKKNGSISSFASVEFKLPDNRVHPEGDESSSAVTQPRRPSSVRRRVLQDSLDTLHVRCGQYCPIL